MKKVKLVRKYSGSCDGDDYDHYEELMDTTFTVKDDVDSDGEYEINDEECVHDGEYVYEKDCDLIEEIHNYVIIVENTGRDRYSWYKKKIGYTFDVSFEVDSDGDYVVVSGEYEDRFINKHDCHKVLSKLGSLFKIKTIQLRTDN